MKLTTVTSYKGGVGKSTTSIHLATFLSEHGTVLLVDCDKNRTAIAWAERGSLPFDVLAEKAAYKVLSDYDFAIIDTPANPDSNDLKELADASDLLILPTLPDVVSLDPMLQTAENLKGTNYRALISIVPPKPNTDGVRLKSELKAANFPVFESMIRRSIGISKAALAGKPVRDLAGGDRMAWQDYEKLGNEVLEALSNE